MNDISILGAFLEAFDNSDEGVAIWDANDDLLGCNKKYENIFFRNIITDCIVMMQPFVK